MSRVTTKQLGILGGLSWHSTEVYYRLINEMTTSHLGDDHGARILVHSLDFREITDLFKNRKAAVQRLVEECLRLEEFGCEALMLASNTVHFAYGAISDRLKIPVFHIADAVGERLKCEGVKCTALLGTQYTMNLPFYKKRLLEKYGIEVRIPEAADIEAVNRIIYDELVKGIVLPESKETFQAIVSKMVIGGVQAVIAGCTEIPMLLQDEDCNVLVVDSAREHCCYGVERIVGS